MRFSIETICGRKIESGNRTPPFKYTINFEPVSYTCGGFIFQGRLNHLFDLLHSYFPMGYKSPIHLIVKDVDSNKIVQTGTETTIITPKIGGRNYEFTLTDGCGVMYSFDTIWPILAQSSVPNATTSKGYGCIDSTAYVEIQFLGYGPITKIEILSGPKFLHSTKPDFSYFDSIVYPQTYYSSSNYFCLKNLPKGIYHYRISDTCGHEFDSSFEILNTDLVDLHKPHMQYWYKKGCLNGNTFYFKSIDPGYFDFKDIEIYDIINRHYVYSSGSYNGKLDSVTTVQSGIFEITLSNSVCGLPINVNIDKCITFYDTTEVKPYQRPRTNSVTIIKCNGNITAILNPDSTRGVPPYQFEVITGPKLYPLQSSNEFDFIPQGVYTSRIVDACGNSNVLDFSVDTLLFPPITKIGSSCLNGNFILFYNSSPFFTYYWTKPDGSIYIGDTLRVNGVVYSDTGMYHITRYVNINNCKDSFTTSYRLTSTAEYPISKTICEGDSVILGNHTYTQGGNYSDTITSINCDTIYRLNLNVLPTIRIITDTTICVGDLIVFQHHFYDKSGSYSDTFTSNYGCDSIVTLNLNVVQSLPLEITASKTIVVPGDTVQLTAISTQPIFNYIWTSINPLSASYIPNPIATINYAGWIYLDVRGGSRFRCTNTDSIFIDTVRTNPIDTNSTCNAENVFIPNSFSPNGDGMNDVFRVRSKALQSGKLIIYNRVGNKVFESDDIMKGWDGSYKGQPEQLEVYAYYFEGKCLNGETIILKGNVTLLR